MLAVPIPLLGTLCSILAARSDSLPTLPTLELPSASAVWQGLQMFLCRELRYYSGSTDDKTATVVVLVGPASPTVALPSVFFLRRTSFLGWKNLVEFSWNSIRVPSRPRHFRYKLVKQTQAKIQKTPAEIGSVAVSHHDFIAAVICV